MIPKECKRLAEVDFPIAVVSKHSAREKSIRHGHPSTLHLWWARRPLAACRSMLMALLLPDPEDKLCPAEFKVQARRILEESRLPGKKPKTDADLRARLLAFIGDFADWDNAGSRTYLETARGLVKVAHPEETPLVVDPFAGGGSIPLEALRLGCDTFASDLNPLACLINKVMLEVIPRQGRDFGERFNIALNQVKCEAEKELRGLYPRDTDGARPIAYLWARTVQCEQPDCGVEIPIFKSPWLSKKGSKRAKFFKENPDGDCVAILMDSPERGPITFRIARGYGSETARLGYVALRATKATGNNSNVLCPCCNKVLKGDRVMAQLTVQRGGANTTVDDSGDRTGAAFLLCVVTVRDGIAGKHFRVAARSDYQAVAKAIQRLALSPHEIPEGRLNPTRPSPNARGLSAPTRYGIMRFADLFTARQRVAITALAKHINHMIAREPTDDPRGYGLILALGRCIDQSSAQVRWISNIEAIASSFPRQALQMTWDFVESVPIGEQSANFGAAGEWVRKVIEMHSLCLTVPGQCQQADARHVPLPDGAVNTFFTDPPYYDAVPYADLADFFLSCLKPAFSDTAFRQFKFDAADGLSPKAQECVWNRAHLVNGIPKDPAYFESGMHAAFKDGRRLLSADGIGCVVFAHKSTEGWEALLNGLLSAGWVIQASWPIVTERGVRTNAQNTASLASSVHLICRPRPENAGIGDWGQVLRELPKRVADWMERLQVEGVRGADLVFACIGPALEIYSRYTKVVDAEEREIPLGGNPESREPHQRGYLAYVWEVVGRAALEQVLGSAESKARNGAAGALEEDARLTALFLWTLQATTQDAEPPSHSDEDAEDDEPEDEGEEEAPTSTKKKKGLSLPFDVARRFAQPLGIHLDVWEGRCIETEKGIVRLIPVLDRTKQLFGEDGAAAVADRLEKHRTGPIQPTLFPVDDDPPPTPIKGRKRKGGANVSDESLHRHRGATTLDHVHAAMLLQSSGRANALRALLMSEVQRGPDFLRLANALSALYPQGSDEKRLLDAMLMAVPR